MDRSAINAALLQHHEAFIARVLAVPMNERDVSRNGKWTSAQQIEHILRAVRPVSMALRVPKWFLRWRFGRPNRTARDYDGLVQRYKEKLAAGGRASGRFVPPAVGAGDVQRIADSLRGTVKTLCERVNAWTEPELDTVLLPHPLLGKLTVREMLYFTIYHAQHHQALVERDSA
jgi:hypothetical protein